MKPVYNDHPMGYFSTFWSSSRWPMANTPLSWRRIANTEKSFVAIYTVLYLIRLRMIQRCSQRTCTKRSRTLCKHMIITAREHHYVSSHWQLDCLINIFRITTKETTQSSLLFTQHATLVSHIHNSDLSDMAEIASFSPPAWESTIEYRTSPLQQACMSQSS